MLASFALIKNKKRVFLARICHGTENVNSSLQQMARFGG